MVDLDVGVLRLAGVIAGLAALASSDDDRAVRQSGLVGLIEYMTQIGISVAGVGSVGVNPTPDQLGGTRQRVSSPPLSMQPFRSQPLSFALDLEHPRRDAGPR